MLLCVYRGPDTVINEAYNAVNQTSVAANEPVRDPDTVINEAYNAVNQTSRQTICSLSSPTYQPTADDYEQLVKCI